HTRCLSDWSSDVCSSDLEATEPDTAAISPGTALTVAIDACHLLGTGVWLGGLVALGALLRAASRDADADDRAHAVITARRFSRRSEERRVGKECRSRCPP